MLRSSLAAFALAAVGALLALDCGGKIDSGAPCPSDLGTACPENGTCTQTVTDCEGTHHLACACTADGWQCPQLGAPSCPQPTNQCPTKGAKAGDSCSSSGLRCESATQLACVNAPILYCTCDGSKFSCDTPTNCEPPPKPACPPPSTVQEGAACSLSGFQGMCSSDTAYYDCDGNYAGTLSCFCSDGHWSCPTDLPPCPLDAGSADGL